MNVKFSSVNRNFQQNDVSVASRVPIGQTTDENEENNINTADDMIPDETDQNFVDNEGNSFEEENQNEFLNDQDDDQESQSEYFNPNSGLNAITKSMPMV